jgi:hypothetical protein
MLNRLLVSRSFSHHVRVPEHADQAAAPLGYNG